MKKNTFLISLIISIISVNFSFSQSTEDFEGESDDSTTFTDNTVTFTLSSSAPDIFEINSFNNGGWNGSAADNKFVDNNEYLAAGANRYINAGTNFKITPSTNIVVKELFLFVANLEVSGFENTVGQTVTISGNLSSVQQFSFTITSFSNVDTFSPNNGFTEIDFSTQTTDYSNITIDELIISSTATADYLAMDAFTWDVASPSCSAPSAQATSAVFGAESATTLNLSSFTAPVGDSVTGYAIYMNDTNSFTAPSDGDEPTADDSWNGAGQQPIYFGTSVSPNVTVTGLTPGDTYYIQIYAYNDCSGTETYETIGLNASDTTTATLTWDGSINNDWATADNWTPATIPGSGTDVSIPSGLTNYPTASGSVTVNTVSMASGTSLIAQNTFTGTVTYTRNLATTNWYLVGAPVAGETIEDMISNNSFDIGSGSNIGLAPYDNSQASANDRWNYQTAGSTGSLTSGGGYSLKLGSAGNLAFTGTMETSDVGISISVGAGNAFNLVGNPYPSYLAGNDNAAATNNLLAINTSSLTEETLWLWNQGTNSYDQINQASSAFHIAPGQGFFVSSTGSNTFNFTEAMQSHQSTDSFQRGGKISASRPEIQLIISDGSTQRDTDVFYINGTTTGFDNGYDSSIFGGASTSFEVYTGLVANSQGQKLGIQSLPDSNFENMIIPVGVISDAGAVTFTANASNLPSGYKLFLEDKHIGSFIQLDAQNSKYDVILDAAVNNIGRFYLHVTTNALSNDTFNLSNISAYLSASNSLRVVGIHKGYVQVRLFTILGKKVVNSSFQASGVDDVTLPNLRQGVYVLQLNSEEGSINKKIVIE